MGADWQQHLGACSISHTLHVPRSLPLRCSWLDLLPGPLPANTLMYDGLPATEPVLPLNRLYFVCSWPEPPAEPPQLQPTVYLSDLSFRSPWTWLCRSLLLMGSRQAQPQPQQQHGEYLAGIPHYVQVRHWWQGLRLQQRQKLCMSASA